VVCGSDVRCSPKEHGVGVGIVLSTTSSSHYLRHFTIISFR
jgi:hypothetical protein